MTKPPRYTVVCRGCGFSLPINLYPHAVARLIREGVADGDLRCRECGTLTPIEAERLREAG